jgi:hypothetical protein
MRAAAKLIALLTLSVAALSSQLLAQTTPVYTYPTGSQTINQPSGTSFGVSLTNTSRTANPVSLNTLTLNCAGPGYSQYVESQQNQGL